MKSNTRSFSYNSQSIFSNADHVGNYMGQGMDQLKFVEDSV